MEKGRSRETDMQYLLKTVPYGVEAICGDLNDFIGVIASQIVVFDCFRSEQLLKL
jgi:hypothetical protein